ncbi:hypothetical protein FRX31_012945 [Thalictrum thalictroides]|uniref:Transmembrane protein n=1 Tax=Thalictrum thalictroides TaxID=46969 RepID=A0A7J6WM13_THATH|nr:hypothetical protein FRX31_012945 [Thalictrum thalictroides]
MGASLSTTEGRMTANERADWKRATDQKRAIVRRALDRIIATPGILFIYVKIVLNNAPCSTTTTVTALPLFLLAGAFMVMTVYGAFFSLKEIGERMARERFRRARSNGVKTQKLSSFLRVDPAEDWEYKNITDPAEDRLGFRPNLILPR